MQLALRTFTGYWAHISHISAQRCHTSAELCQALAESLYRTVSPASRRDTIRLELISNNTAKQILLNLGVQVSEHQTVRRSNEFSVKIPNEPSLEIQFVRTYEKFRINLNKKIMIIL